MKKDIKYSSNAFGKLPLFKIPRISRIAAFLMCNRNISKNIPISINLPPNPIEYFRVLYTLSDHYPNAIKSYFVTTRFPEFKSVDRIFDIYLLDVYLMILYKRTSLSIKRHSGCTMGLKNGRYVVRIIYGGIVTPNRYPCKIGRPR